MLKLIVNADDFGHSEVVNEAMLKSFQNGILRSASLLANGKSFDHAVRIIKSNPDLDIGIHLALTGEKPILSSDEIHSLIFNEGSFHRNAIDFAKKYFSEKISLEEVKSELTAQIEKLLDHGIKISHIDSHQHLHILPKILNIITELASRYNIMYIRFPREIFSHYMFYELKSSVVNLAELAVVNYFCSKVKGQIPFSTDHFAGFYFGGRLSERNLITLINNLPANGTCELMCHPGFERNNDGSQYRKVEEAQALIDQEVVQLIKLKNIEITSFKNLLR